MVDAIWQDVCELEELLPGTGVAALIDEKQVAVVRSSDGAAVYALSNYDPFSHANVISRGIVGDRGGVPKIASPMYKHNFDLRTGACLDNASVQLQTYPVRVVDGRIQVAFVPGEAVL